MSAAQCGGGDGIERSHRGTVPLIPNGGGAGGATERRIPSEQLYCTVMVWPSPETPLIPALGSLVS